MVKNTTEIVKSLYHDDETAWLELMSRIVAEKRFEELDHESLSEYLADMARRDRREVLNRLTVLLAHLIKWDRLPDQHTSSWQATIVEQRNQLKDLLESGTLLNHAREVLGKAYERAVKQVTLEAELDQASLPGECPYSLDTVLTEE